MIALCLSAGASTDPPSTLFRAQRLLSKLRDLSPDKTRHLCHSGGGSERTENKMTGRRRANAITLEPVSLYPPYLRSGSLVRPAGSDVWTCWHESEARARSSEVMVAPPCDRSSSFLFFSFFFGVLCDPWQELFHYH